MATKPPLVLVMDVGNTSTTLGLYQAGRITASDRVPTAERNVQRIRNALNKLLKKRLPDGLVLSSVVPAVNGLWRRATKMLWPKTRFITVSPALNLGVKVSYPNPKTIGADRLANACGAVSRYGAPVIVADFGTAVTFDVITSRDGYVGGVIAPGLPLMFSYLAEKTALLPLIGPGPIRHRVGRSTREAMQMGARWGYLGMVREIIKELLGDPALRGARLCATGGYAAWVLRGSDLGMTIDPTLTLRGLGRIYELNA